MEPNLEDLCGIVTTHGTVVVDHCKEPLGPAAFKILIFNPWRRKFLADLQVYGAVDVLDHLLAAFGLLIQEVFQGGQEAASLVTSQLISTSCFFFVV